MSYSFPDISPLPFASCDRADMNKAYNCARYYWEEVSNNLRTVERELETYILCQLRPHFTANTHYLSSPLKQKLTRTDTLKAARSIFSMTIVIPIKDVDTALAILDPYLVDDPPTASEPLQDISSSVRETIQRFLKPLQFESFRTHLTSLEPPSYWQAGFGGRWVEGDGLAEFKPWNEPEDAGLPEAVSRIESCIAQLLKATECLRSTSACISSAGSCTSSMTGKAQVTARLDKQGDPSDSRSLRKSLRHRISRVASAVTLFKEGSSSKEVELRIVPPTGLCEALRELKEALPHLKPTLDDYDVTCASKVSHFITGGILTSMKNAPGIHGQQYRPDKKQSSGDVSSAVPGTGGGSV